MKNLVSLIVAVVLGVIAVLAVQSYINDQKAKQEQRKAQEVVELKTFNINKTVHTVEEVQASACAETQKIITIASKIHRSNIGSYPLNHEDPALYPTSTIPNCPAGGTYIYDITTGQVDCVFPSHNQ